MGCEFVSTKLFGENCPELAVVVRSFVNLCRLRLRRWEGPQQGRSSTDPAAGKRRR